MMLFEKSRIKSRILSELWYSIEEKKRTLRDLTKILMETEDIEEGRLVTEKIKRLSVEIAGLKETMKVVKKMKF